MKRNRNKKIKKITLAEFSAKIGELAKSVNRDYWAVKTQLTSSQFSTKLEYSAYIDGYNWVSSISLEGCIQEMKNCMGVKTTLDQVICEL